ncbi:bifunctional adenosylcobinamide kinase/adenosylcobinamide-phosphate guanylyltransferase [Allobranchiibius sp. GilTou73]|uniref:bifunctional adenosylcobinamide kinase/adenosylcobinamide-phosphate guanylyltransferase n=1 Tax=unclassified Allobranchiibius TaxID=2649857 RepID=UPI001AA0D280|nr:bifunctional adenosylcobinamide kinase/adenosylcobinamide-phosphate guanylyltransferase [Allobranchiibius sp. GilTou73]MBO1765335.1 bifunctional adenosylcobinamide kinase/adenosylcobinamide-phosphate guanylyltransferase [Allobranchiibius sp. GilTou38]UIJ35203.1 bifunctional adenosylcobinamide kinase/adenosylcobinamide-phosphate guanylyltransferase [Allobranchiibius sp. GilTou73]
MKTLILGGIRSGKSAVAERTLAGVPAVTYVATGPGPELDDDWAHRVHAHRERRPAHWSTVESVDLPAVFADLTRPALVDGLGTWLTAHLDRLQAWDAPREDWEPAALTLIDDLATAVRDCAHDLVIVSDEVGLTLVPEHRSARVFADLLGLTNQRVADACDAVQLVVAGQVLTVKAP